MADLFSVTSPLVIRSPRGGEKVIAELFPHPNGLLFFEIFWNQMPDQKGIHLIEGEVHGEGPWKVGEYVIHVLGCHGSNADLALEFSQWQMYLQSPMHDYPDQLTIRKLAHTVTKR